MEYECKMCFDDIIEDNIVMYKLTENDNLKKFDYCTTCLTMLINTIWMKYIESLKKSDCEKSLMNLIISGPPVNFRDNRIEENKEIYEFYIKGNTFSAKLTGSLNHVDRDKLYNKLLEIVNVIKNKSAENNDVDKYNYLDNLNMVLTEFNL